MGHELDDITYLIAALAQARNDGVDVQELVWLALDSISLVHFDALVDTYTQYTRPPEGRLDLPEWWESMCH